MLPRGSCCDGDNRPEADIMEPRTTLVTAALDEVATLRASDFRGKELAIARLLRAYGESSDLANHLWAGLSAELQARRRDISDLLGLWVWRTPDKVHA